MRVLVVYGTKRAGTFGIADLIGDQLTDAGIRVDVRPADHRMTVTDYDAVIVGGALYANRWHRDARRFVERHAAALRTRPVWLFSSGPLDDSASRADLPPVPQVEKLAEHVGARGHITFGGRLTPDATGFPARAMARTRAGDWREPPRIRAWADAVATELRGATRAT